MACDYDSDAILLMRAAQIVWREMFHVKKFDGSFKPECQPNSVLPSLLALVNMIQDRANIKQQTELMNTATTTSALSASQLMVFSSVKRTTHAGSMQGPQFVTTRAVKPHCRCTWHWKSMLWLVAEHWLIFYSSWEYAYHMIVSWHWHQTSPMVYICLKWKVLRVHLACALVSSLREQLVISTIIQDLQHQEILSMELLSLSCSTQCIHLQAMSVVWW